MKKKIISIILIVLVVNLCGVHGATPVAGEDTIYYEDVEQFPESYHEALYALKELHPNWSFVMYDTGLEWDTVLYNQTNPASRSLVPSYYPANYAGEYYGDGWSYATEEAVSYYMDPRNWLDETYIFQFELLTYNSNVHGIATVQKTLANTFMSGLIEGYEDLTYAQAFHDIGAYYGISSVHLAARVRQEQGVKGDSPLISGIVPGYEGYYNYFNIQASGSTEEEIVINGLNEAVAENWDSRYAALLGGSYKVASKYILRGQDTLYLQKFDVDGRYDGRYWHQYMQNICAPSSEGRTVKLAYESAGMLNEDFIFKIPVYYNMPDGKKIDIEDGVYTISTYDSYQALTVENSVLADGGNISFEKYTQTEGQQWKIEQVEEGFYKITSLLSGRSLDAANGNTADGANISQWEYWQGDNQIWYIQEASDGGFYIRCKANDMYLTADTNDSTSNACLWSKNSKKVQSFMLEKVAIIEDASLFLLDHSDTTITIGMTTVVNIENPNLEYRWNIYDCASNEIVFKTEWVAGNEWLFWNPTGFGDYRIVGEARVADNVSSYWTVETTITHHPEILGMCQMPYDGEGGGFLIGVETDENPNQSYSYELLILDCTLLAEGKDAWIWTTTPCRVESGNAFWAVWQPQYGYYWTLFRIYDENGNLIDQACYPFQNI